MLSNTFNPDTSDSTTYRPNVCVICETRGFAGSTCPCYTTAFREDAERHSGGAVVTIRFYGVHKTDDGRYAVIAVDGPSPCTYHYDAPLSVHSTYQAAQRAAGAVTR